MTAPDRLARHDVPQLLRLDELAQRGCPAEFLARPMRQAPHDQRVLQIGGAGAEYERPVITDRRRRGRPATWRSGHRWPWSAPPTAMSWTPSTPVIPGAFRSILSKPR